MEGLDGMICAGWSVEDEQERVFIWTEPATLFIFRLSCWILTTAPSYRRSAIEQPELADVGTSPSVASGCQHGGVQRLTAMSCRQCSISIKQPPDDDRTPRAPEPSWPAARETGQEFVGKRSSSLQAPTRPLTTPHLGGSGPGIQWAVSETRLGGRVCERIKINRGLGGALSQTSAAEEKTKNNSQKRSQTRCLQNLQGLVTGGVMANGPERQTSPRGEPDTLRHPGVQTRC